MELIKAELVECEKGKVAGLKTKFICSNDNQNLYFRFDCDEIFSYPQHTAYNAPLYEGDIVEVLLTLGSSNRYLEIEVNQLNAKYCVIIENLDGEGKIEIEKLNKCCFSSKIIKRENGWICDIILPLKNFTDICGDIANTYINAHRQDYDKSGNLNLYSLYPTFSRTFHKTSAFRKLINKEE